MKKPVWLCLLSLFVYFAGHNLTAQNTYIDSLKQSLKAEKQDTLKAEMLYSLGLASVDSAFFDDALDYARQLYTLSKKIKSSPGRAMQNAGQHAEIQSWNCRGQIEFSRSNMSLALIYYNVALLLSKNAAPDPSFMAELYSNIASAYAGQGNYDKSLENYLKSLKIDEDAKDTAQLATDYANVAAVLDDSKNRTLSRRYLLKAIELNTKLDKADGLALCMNNLGGAYEKEGDSAMDAGNKAFAKIVYEQALELYFKALKLYKQAGDKEGLGVASENIGSIYSNKGLAEEALSYLLQALEIYKALDLKAETSYCLNKIGKVYQQQHKIAEAEKCFLQSLALAKETHLNDFLMKSNDFLSNFYEETGRPAQALKYYKEYMTYHDSVFNQESAKKLVRTEMNYDFEKKQTLEKAQHEKEIIVLEGENKIQRQWRFFLFTVIAFCVLVLFFVQRAYNNKKRLASFLAAEDSRKELLLQEVHHRINNNLQIISSLLSLQANSADDERLTVYLKQSQNRIQSLSVLHELLYQNNSSLKVNMPDYIDKVLDFHREVAGTLSAKTSIETAVADVQFPTKIAVPLALIINELVTNSLKYAFAEKAEGKIEVLLSTTDEKMLSWKLTVKDNGKGLGDISERRKGSLGLRLVNIMTKQIGGTLIVNEGAGANFEVTFTLKK